MQYTHHHPYNSTGTTDNTRYSNSVPYAEQHSQSYTNPYIPQSTHIPQDGTQQYASLASNLPQYQEMAWNHGPRQQMENRAPNLPYQMGSLNPHISGYSAFPSATQYVPSRHLNEDPTRAIRDSLTPDMSFYRAAEGPRLRTAQACQKCRIRKAKCSGDHPACERCLIKGLVCEYAAEGRVRGPNRLKTKADPHREYSAGPSPSMQGQDSLNTFSELSPSGYHAQAHQSRPNHSQSELRYSGGVDIERLYSNSSGLPYRSFPSDHSGSHSSCPNPSTLGAEADVRYQHSPWVAPSGYERFYDHPERYSS